MAGKREGQKFVRHLHRRTSGTGQPIVLIFSLTQGELLRCKMMLIVLRKHAGAGVN